MNEADKGRPRGVRGTVTLKGGWTREALDAFRPVWRSWRFSGAWGSLAGRPFGPEDRSWTFRGYFYEEFHLVLSHLDGWTRDWIGNHPADTDHPLTAQEYERFLTLAYTLGLQIAFSGLERGQALGCLVSDGQGLRALREGERADDALRWSLYPWNGEKDAFPAGMTETGGCFFAGNRAMTRAELPEQVRVIGEGTFSGCTGLTRVEFPSGLSEIKESAFEDCTGLTAVWIPDGVGKIGDSAFSGCAGLAQVRLPAGLKRLGEWAFYNCAALSHLHIPEGVREIGAAAFSGCAGLTRIDLPASLEILGDGAFAGCEGLTEVRIAPENPHYRMEGRALLGWGGGLLIQVFQCPAVYRVPDGVTELGEFAFSDCAGLTQVALPDGLEQVGGWAFNGCAGLTRLTLPEGVRQIRNNAFDGCEGLREVTVPESVTDIDPSAFLDCAGLTLRAPAGSYAQAFAEGQHLAFRPL